MYKVKFYQLHVSQRQLLRPLIIIWKNGSCTIPSQHSVSSHHRPASETPLNGVLLASRWWPTLICLHGEPTYFENSRFGYTSSVHDTYFFSRNVFGIWSTLSLQSPFSWPQDGFKAGAPATVVIDHMIFACWVYFCDLVVICWLFQK